MKSLLLSKSTLQPPLEYCTQYRFLLFSSSSFPPCFRIMPVYWRGMKGYAINIVTRHLEKMLNSEVTKFVESSYSRLKDKNLLQRDEKDLTIQNDWTIRCHWNQCRYMQSTVMSIHKISFHVHKLAVTTQRKNFKVITEKGLEMSSQCSTEIRKAVEYLRKEHRPKQQTASG